MQNSSMRQPPLQLALRDSDSHAHHTYSEHPYTLDNTEYTTNNDFEDLVFGLQDLEGLQGFHDSTSQQHGSANAFDQSYMSNMDFENQRSVLRMHHDSDPSLQRAKHDNPDFLRGIKGFAERSDPNDRCTEEKREERSFSAAARSSVPMQPQHPAQNLSAKSARQTRYGPFSSRFPGSDDAKRHRHLNTRFNRQPYILPSQDLTIRSIEAERERHVERIYNAMTSGDAARDNSGSIAMKRWVHAAHYQANLVEAYAHKVFDCLLAQAKDGFRGWHHNDYVVDDRKGEDEDRDVNCEERLDNIIRALEEEKTICEDVMNSACQIRMFVNAPRAYANRKYQNRVGNSKRGRAKDTADPNSRALKLRKTSGRQCRTRSATRSDPATMGRANRPLLQSQEPKLPRYEPSSTQDVAPHPSQDFSSPLQGPAVPTPHSYFAGPQANPMSPPTPASAFPQTLHINSQGNRLTSMPQPSHRSPFLSPPALTHTTYSSPVTPIDDNPSRLIPEWQSTSPIIDTHSTEAPQVTYPAIDLPYPHDWPWSDMSSSSLPEPYSSTNLLEQYPSVNGSFTILAQPPGIKAQTPDFQKLWESQAGVQAFPFPGPSDEVGR